MNDDINPEDGPRDYSDDQILKAIQSGAESTSAVADAFGMSRQEALERLRKLEEDGKVRSREVGRMLLWRLNDE